MNKPERKMVLKFKAIAVVAALFSLCVAPWYTNAAPPYNGASKTNVLDLSKTMSDEEVLINYYQTVPKGPNEIGVIVFEHSSNRVDSYDEYKENTSASLPRRPVEGSLQASAADFDEVVIFPKTQSILGEKKFGRHTS